MRKFPEGAGMGSSGLVGQISTFAAMGTGTEVWLLILFFHFLLPGLFAWCIASVLRRRGWIHEAICVFPADFRYGGSLYLAAWGIQAERFAVADGLNRRGKKLSVLPDNAVFAMC